MGNKRTEQRSGGAWKMNTQIIRAQQSIAVHIQIQESEVQNVRPHSLAMWNPYREKLSTHLDPRPACEVNQEGDATETWEAGSTLLKRQLSTIFL